MFWEIFIPTFVSFWLVAGVKSATRMFATLLAAEDRPPLYKSLMILIVSLAAGPLVDGFADGVQDFE